MTLFHSVSGRALAIIFFAIWTTTSAVQTLQIPSQWTNTTSTISRDSREDLASGAASTFMSQIAGGQTFATVQYVSSYHAAIVLQDYYTGKNTWMNDIIHSMQSYYQQIGVYGNPSGWSGDANYWALAFYYAYRTYKKDDLLNTAIAIYNKTYTGAFITPDNAATGSGAGRNVSFSLPLCTSETFAGGVFVGNVSDNIDVCAESVGPFLTLSAYLFEATNQSLYRDAAQLSVDFMIHHMWNGTYVYDTFHLQDCTVDTKEATLNQAGFIEGLSVFANVTRNDTLTTLLGYVVSNVTTFSTWSSNTGVIDESDHSLGEFASNLKGLLIRALLEARARNRGTELDRYIEAYVLNQFNSILSNTRCLGSNSNFYGLSWIDQRASSFDAVGSINALDVLNGAMNLTVSSSGSNGNSSSSATGVPTAVKTSAILRQQSENTGAIVGGVVGGVIIVGSAIGFLLWRLRQKRTGSSRWSSATAFAISPNGGAAFSGVDPFIMSVPARQLDSKRRGFYTPDQEEASASSVQTGNRGQMLEVGSVPSDVLGDVPSLVRRLYQVLHGQPQGELPPAYGS